MNADAFENVGIALNRHPQRPLIQVQQLFLLGAVGLFHFPQAKNQAHDLDVETGALGFGEDFLDVGGGGGLFFFQPFDPLDEGFEPSGGAVAGRGVGGALVECGVWHGYDQSLDSRSGEATANGRAKQAACDA
jgi:hypothetical protein